MFESINFLGLLLAAASTLVIGGIWYGPLFGKPWMRLMGFGEMTPEKMADMKKDAGKGYLGMFIMSFVMAVVYMILAKMTLALTFHDFCKLALLVFIGFQMPMIVGQYFWGKEKSCKLVAINFFHQLISTYVVAMVLFAFI